MAQQQVTNLEDLNQQLERTNKVLMEEKQVFLKEIRFLQAETCGMGLEELRQLHHSLNMKQSHVRAAIEEVLELEL